jgi:hypothetical protein
MKKGVIILLSIVALSAAVFVEAKTLETTYPSVPG